MAFDFRLAVAQQAEGKALGAHPAFMDRSPVSVYAPGATRQDAVISQRSAARHSQAYGGDQAIDWVYDCIGLYTDPVGTAPYRLERTDGTKLVRQKTKGTPPDHEVGPEALYKLLDKPNPFMLYDELLALLVIDLMLVGNGYWFKWNDGTPAMALYRLAPSHVKIVPGPFGPKRYEYQPPGVKDKLKIDPSELIHFRRPNPHDAFYGMGVIQGAGRAMDLELAVTDTMASYYENKADPSLIVQSERRVPRDVFNKLRAQLRARTAGPRNAGELLVLEAGLKGSTLSASASDALFDALSKLSRDRIFTKFRASPKLFGITDETGGADKVSDARREFDNYALRPFLTKLSRQITSALTQDGWDCNFIIDHRSILPAEDAIKVAESLSHAPGIKLREVRKSYEQFGIEESTGDPDIDETVLNLPGEELGPDGQPINGGAGFADQPTGQEPGRPPKVENTRAFPSGAKVQSPAGKSVQEIENALDAILSGKAVSTPAPDNRLPGEVRPDDTFASARRVDINAAQGFIAAELRAASLDLERALLDHVEGKALKTSDLVGRIRGSEAWKAFRTRVESILEEGARQAATSGVMHSGLTPDEDIDYDALAKSVVHRPEGVRSIMKTLRDRVVGRVKEARDNNAERTDYEAAVRSVIAEWGDGQVTAIADTEATTAYNEATLTAAEMSGIDSVLVTDGDDHDQPCEEANGQVWDIATARERRVEHPRCRRAFLPLTASAVA